MDVLTINPNLRYPDKGVNPTEDAFFEVSGFTSSDSFADLPVEANSGLLSISSSLARRGYRVTHLDFNLYDYIKRVQMGKAITLEDIANILQGKRATVYAISCMTSSISKGIEIAKLVKKIHKTAYVVLGGIHPSLFPEELLVENADCVDFVIKGEGEISLARLLDALRSGMACAELPTINGLCYLDNGRVVINQPRPLDLSTEDSTLDFTFWPSDVPFTPRVNMSRGCAGNCSYCSANRFFNGKQRLRNMENIITDIESCVSNGYDKILFGDLSFGCHKQIAVDVCQYIIDRQLNMKWWAQMRLRDCDSDLLKLMAQAGCRQIALGFESADPKILETVSAEKGNQRGTYEICEEINSLGISLQGYFIFGLPNETMESAFSTIRYMESLLPYNMEYVHISVCVPFPGTELYEHPEKHGIEIVDYNYDHYTMNADPNTHRPVFNGPYLNRNQVYELWQLALATAEKHLSTRERVNLDEGYGNIFCERFYPRLVI